MVWRFPAQPYPESESRFEWVEVLFLHGQDMYLFAGRRELGITGAAPMTYVSDEGPAEYLWFNEGAGFEQRDTKRPELTRGPSEYPYRARDLIRAPRGAKLCEPRLVTALSRPERDPEGLPRSAKLCEPARYCPEPSRARSRRG